MLFSFLFFGYSQIEHVIHANHSEIELVLNPYDNINWELVDHHKAALHVHTLQSDGYHLLNEVVMAYKNAGFTILSITDHDWNRPNARVGWGHVPEEQASPYPKDPKPDNYPANTTWPWTDYGGPDPREVGMFGIQGSELTFRHHMNSYFSDYGVWYERTGTGAPYGGIVDEEDNEIWEDDKLKGIKETDGIAVLDHPGLSDHHGFWQRRPLDWYIERFENHSYDFLIGMEVTNTDRYVDMIQRETYDEGLWDQLLARFMPERPIWGFGTDDMHRFDDNKDSHTAILVENLDEESVREAMVRGQFYFTKSTRKMDLLNDEQSQFPVILQLVVNESEGTINIDAENYDRIVWITAPGHLDPIEDYVTSDMPWEPGARIHVGSEFKYMNNQLLKNYVRAELIREEDGEIYRTFTNPFGFSKGD